MSTDTSSWIKADQREITRLCAQTGVMLLQHGAESALVESVARRLGLALGMDSLEVALMANGITVTTICEGRCHTTVRRNIDRGINMHVVTEVQRTMLLAEEKQLDLAGVGRRLGEIQPFRYPRLLVSVMVGLSCAAFARLGLLARGGEADFGTFLLTFIASGVAMQVRQYLAHLHFNPLVNFAAAAFVATSIAAQGVIHGWVDSPKVAMSACVLLFVPGFPLINAVSDMVKGYINTGISRGVMAVLLLLACCGGIICAMTAWNTWTWL
ncbi:MAG: threonine/serine exporter ThrE family protein [Verrucomicrobia bacterium]|nr:threonine/serine exporter ThrE family protein [Verrucomicrobiota bacterium]